MSEITVIKNRHLKKIVRKRVAIPELKAVTQDLKPIYKAPTEEATLEALSEFDGKRGQKYPIITKSWMDNWAELVTIQRIYAGLFIRLTCLKGFTAS